jgi:hypothetical protein
MRPPFRLKESTSVSCPTPKAVWVGNLTGNGRFKKFIHQKRRIGNQPRACSQDSTNSAQKVKNLSRVRVGDYTPAITFPTALHDIGGNSPLWNRDVLECYDRRVKET